jgi:transcriptional regulator with XRE-family HTH domain
MEKIKKYRYLRKMTQKQLAEITGLSQSYINELERGKKKNPSKMTLDKLAQGLAISVSEIIGEKK